MNILEEEDFSNKELSSIKQAYLEKENLWMSKQIDFVNELIRLYKQIIKIQGQPQSQEYIELITQQIKSLVDKKKQEYKEIKEQELEEPEADITEDQFRSMIESYQQKVGKLQEAIRVRESELQAIEQGKNRDGVMSSFKRYEPKLVNSIQMHGKLLDRIRKGNKKLRQQKCQLENELLSAKSGLKSQQSTLPSHITRQVTGRTDRYISSNDQMSTFEKAILILKKKRYSNDMLEERINQLTKKIAEKRNINKSLQSQVSKLEWSCIENMDSLRNGYVESNCSEDMSMWEKPVQDNVSFSVDVSRFIKLMPRS